MALPLIQYNKNRYYLLCFFFYISHVHTLIRLSKKRKHNKEQCCVWEESYTGLEQEARLTSAQLGKIKTTHQLFTILRKEDYVSENRVLRRVESIAEARNVANVGHNKQADKIFKKSIKRQ